MPLLIQKTNKYRADKHEKKVARLMGGKVTVGSGNQMDKGDVKTDEFRVECKTTKAASFSLREEILCKITDEALATDRLPMVNIQFEATGNRYVILREEDWLDLKG